MNSLLQDIRYGVRVLARNPVSTVASIAALALGIGLNAAMFSVINALIFKPLPAKNPDQLVVVSSRDRHMYSPHGLYYPDYLYYKEHNEVFSGLLAYMVGPLTLSDGGPPERIRVSSVSGNYFSTLGVEPHIGRVFFEEDIDALSPVIVLSHSYWQRRYLGDPDIVGKSVTVSGQSLTVIGVLQEAFSGVQPLMPVDAFVPTSLVPQLYKTGRQLIETRRSDTFRLIGRLKQRVSVEQAGSALNVLAEELAQQYPETNKGATVMVVPETRARPDPEIGAFLPSVSLIFMALVGLVLLIACSNVVTLTLAQAARRQSEMAVRAALGAGRWRLMRQTLTESLLTAVAGGIAALILAALGTNVLGSMRIEVGFPVKLDASLDWRVFLFTLSLTLFAACFSGIAPALKGARPDLHEGLKEGHRTVGSGSRLRLYKLLVTLQVTASVILMACGGLFIQSLRNAENIDLGFRTDNLLILSVSVGEQGYDKVRGQRFYRDLIEQVDSAPAVQSAALAMFVPLGFDKHTYTVFTENGAFDLPGDGIGVHYNTVSTKYFETVGTPILEGRHFTEVDDASTPRVAIVNATMAQRLWPGNDPIGKRFKLERNGPLVSVIGVARDTKFDWIYEEARPFFYLPLSQDYSSAVSVFVHTNSDPHGLVPSIRTLVAGLDPGLPLYDIRTMEEHLRYGPALFPARLGATLIVTFGLLGLVLGAIGVYGIISYSVSQRIHEIGVRLALGAEPQQMSREVVRQAMKLTLTGIALGVGGAMLFSRLIWSLLFGVSTVDPATFALVAAVLCGVGLLASYGPARKASKVDPIVALRDE